MKNSRWVLVCILLFAGLLIPWPAAGQAQTPATDCYQNAACLALKEQAAERSKAGDLAEAVRLYKLAFEVRADPRLLFNIARLLHKLGQTAEAVPYYQKFLDAPIEDREQRRKAQEYLEQIQTVPTPAPSSVSPSPSTAALTITTAVPAVPHADGNQLYKPVPTPAPSPANLPPSVKVVPTATVTPAWPRTVEKPLYKRGWFWVVLGGASAVTALGIGLGVGLSRSTITVVASR